MSTTSSSIVAAFDTALIHQFLVILALVVVLSLVWNALRTTQFRRALAAGAALPQRAAGAVSAEPAARKMLRISFGLLWVLDGLLQLQGSMPLGMPSGVLTPAASGSQGWVVHMVAWGANVWSEHPVSAAAATVWIQLGVGLLLLVAPRGNWSRFAGLVSVGWGLIVWSFGEAFGGIFAPGGSILFGLPGGVLFYVIAGALLALDERVWRTPSLGKALARVSGAFFLGMAVLQAWPGHGNWTGQPHPSATPGALTAMVQSMAQTPQPGFLARWVSSFASFDAAHGFGVNLFIVITLGVIGACLASGVRRFVWWGTAIAAVFCLAVWVLIQDLGFLGGVGTDPNSMIPLALVVGSGYLAMARLPAEAPATALQPAPLEAATARRGLLERVSPSYLLQFVAGLGACAVVLVGAAPMALAATNPHADATLTEALNFPPTAERAPAYPFTFTDQHGARVSLTSLRGHTVVLTFLDPVCTSDCPIIAQELHAADEMLGSAATTVDFVAIVANPLFRSVAVTQAFDAQEGLTHVRNWYYLTGSLTSLQTAWTRYGVMVDIAPAGAMVAHSDIVYLIGRTGDIREVIAANPGNSEVLHSSFTTLLVDEIDQVDGS